MENIKLTDVWGWLRQLASTQEDEVVNASDESIEPESAPQVEIEVEEEKKLPAEVVEMPVVEEEPELKHLSDKVIFLSFDGVLVSGYNNYMLKCKRLPMEDGYGRLFDPVCVNWLREILDETGADIIVTSKWKEHLRLKDLQNMWKMRGLPGSIADVTAADERRGDEIAMWLSDCREMVQYVILDASPVESFNDDQINHLIRLNPNDGLNRTVAKRTIELLNL